MIQIIMKDKRMNLAFQGDWSFISTSKEKVKPYGFKWDAYQKFWYKDIKDIAEFRTISCSLISIFPDMLKLEDFIPFEINFEKPVQQPIQQAEQIDIGDIDSRFVKLLKPHQIESLRMFKKNENKLYLAHEMGAGKTLSAIAIALNNKKRCFIVVPKSLQERWVEEFVKFDLIPANKIIVMDGKKEQILKCFEKQYEVYIISYEKLRFVASLDAATAVEKAIYKQIQKFDFNDFLLVFEEMYKIKNYKALLYKAYHKFRWNNPWWGVVGLSGSPLEKDLWDYYNNINILQKNVVSYGDMQNFYTYQTNWGEVVFRNHDKFNEAVSELVHRVKKEDIIKDLPPLTQEFRMVNHSSHAHTIKANILGHADSVFSAYTMLRVVDSNIDANVDNSFKEVLEQCEHTGKYSELEDILEEIGSKQIFIYTAFARTAKYLERKLTENKFKCKAVTGESKNPQADVNNFLKGDYQLLIGTSVLARGIDMPHIDYIVLWDVPVSAATYSQVIARIHRINSTRGKTAITLVSDIIERDVYKILEKKFKHIEQFVEGTKDENIMDALAKNWGIKKTHNEKEKKLKIDEDEYVEKVEDVETAKKEYVNKQSSRLVDEIF